MVIVWSYSYENPINEAHNDAHNIAVTTHLKQWLSVTTEVIQFDTY